MNYYEFLKSPAWQKQRLRIFERDEFTCQSCLDTNTQLHVHHKRYQKDLENISDGDLSESKVQKL